MSSRFQARFQLSSLARSALISQNQKLFHSVNFLIRRPIACNVVHRCKLPLRHPKDLNQPRRWAILSHASNSAPRRSVIYYQLRVYRFPQRKKPVFQQELPEYPIVFSLLRRSNRQIEKQNESHISNPRLLAHTTSNASISSTESRLFKAQRQSCTYSPMTDPTRYLPPR